MGDIAGQSSKQFATFLKYFSSRLVQGVVQARVGREVSTECSAEPDPADWFNIKVDELGEISAYVKQVIPAFPPHIETYTLEFILYTADGKYLPLECWQVSVDSHCDSAVDLRTDFYLQLGFLLRSIYAAARVTPLFRHYVRRQGEDSFVILYHIYEGPATANLGEETKEIRLGYLPSPFGTLVVDLKFRTKMELPPGDDRGESLVGDRRSVDRSDDSSSPGRPAVRPTFSKAIPVKTSETKVELNTPISPNMNVFHAGTPGTPLAPMTPQTSPVETPMSESVHSNDSDDILMPSLDKKECYCFKAGHSFPKMSQSNHTGRTRNNSFPFAVLLSSSLCNCSAAKINAPPAEPVLDESVNEQKEEAIVEKKEEMDEEEDTTIDSQDDSYVKLFPFPGEDLPGTNLGSFLQECRMGPQTLNSVSEDDPRQLVALLGEFEKNVPNFDEFVKAVTDAASDDE